MDPATSLTIRGIRYAFVRTREQQHISIYRNRNTYLRIGPQSLIARERKRTELFMHARYLAPQIIACGEYGKQAYFVERSIGARPFGKLFIRDCEQAGTISAHHMASFEKIVSRYAAAQLAAQHQRKNWTAFARSVHLQILQKELPAKSAVIRRAYDRVRDRLSVFPFVLSHGDFNPHNIFPRGVIDMEHVCFAPAGYDLITAVIHVDTFPDDDGYEYHRLYSFSERQKNVYLTMLDRHFFRKGLPIPSRYIREFRFCRMVWSAARMQRHPLLQQWRYRLLDRVMRDLYY